jgi:hypothetical protein
LINSVSASGGSIAGLYIYPGNGETYESVDQIVYQLTAVNTNTTISVSIDGRPPILMNYQGEINEVVNGDTVSRDWYVWHIPIPSINDPGKHTLQFFSHYYVWQETDQYWAEFNAHTDVKSFYIAFIAAPSRSPPSSTSAIPTYALPIAVLSMLVTLLALAKFKTQRPINARNLLLQGNRTGRNMRIKLRSSKNCLEETLKSLSSEASSE